MGWGTWLKRLFGGRRPATETVPYMDPASRRIVRIPVTELRPGMVRVRLLPGDGEVVWMWADQMRPGHEVWHPPFDEEVRGYIRQIREAFAEQRPLSFEEWEDGFRRDLNALMEIAIWSYAADVYRSFADNEVSPERRGEIYRVIVTCLTASPDTIWRVLQLSILSQPEAEQIIKRVYGKHY